MNEVRGIGDFFSQEAKGVQLVRALVEFYKSSSPYAQQDLEPGFHALVSVIQTYLTDEYNRNAIASILDEGEMGPLMERWALKHALNNGGAASAGTAPRRKKPGI